MPVRHWDDVDGALLLDVRDAVGTGGGGRARARSTSRCRNCARASASCRATARSCVICRSGGRAYYATRILLQNGFKARTLSGGMLSRTYSQLLTS